MKPENWQKLKGILEQAVEIAPENRVSYLEKVCAGDANLRREAEAFLEYEDDSDWLEDSAFSIVAENETNKKSLVGTEIGRYKIVSELGAGGMGAVFLAERADGEFSQKVALKLIKRGMDSDAVLRRFYNERQILASLEHPNIAHLVDGGTTGEGVPYFVMEYVEGATILEYADAQNLDLTERLNLFCEVCAAVQFAHQNLVIHRDLKPSNILITSDGKAKLLDFGIAKLLNSDAQNQTATQMQIFTPEYASPEQTKGAKLTTATDVYSLGVILYELLTGTRPFQTAEKSRFEISEAVITQEPPRPSSIVQNSKFKIRKRKTAINFSQKIQFPKIKDQKPKIKTTKPTQNSKSKIQNY